MSSTRSRLLFTWVTVVLAWVRMGALCSRTWRMVRVVSSSVRPSLSRGTATITTSSTSAPAAISPAISPTDTRAPVLGLWSARLADLGSARRGHSSRAPRRPPTCIGSSSAGASDDRPQLGQPLDEPSLDAPVGGPVVVLADQRVRRVLLRDDAVGVGVRVVVGLAVAQ